MNIYKIKEIIKANPDSEFEVTYENGSTRIWKKGHCISFIANGVKNFTVAKKESGDMNTDQNGKKIGSVESVMKDTAEQFKNHMPEIRSKWDQYVYDNKCRQAFEKLDELGLYHDSGLYGWIPKKDQS